MAHCQPISVRHQQLSVIAAGSSTRLLSCAGRLGHDARVLYLEKLVTAGQGAHHHLQFTLRGSLKQHVECPASRELTGKAAWLDKDKTRCLVLWRTIPEWSDYIQSWVQDYGLQDSVFDLAELSVGDEVRGTGALLGTRLHPARCMSPSTSSSH